MVDGYELHNFVPWQGLSPREYCNLAEVTTFLGAQALDLAIDVNGCL
jgi:hypothetical protein